MISPTALEKESEKKVWGRAYGTEAVTLLLSVVFDQQGWHRAELYTLADNKPTIRSAEKCGFHRSGFEHESTSYDGTYHGVAEMEQLKSEWDARGLRTKAKRRRR